MKKGSREKQPETDFLKRSMNNSDFFTARSERERKKEGERNEKSTM